MITCEELDLLYTNVSTTPTLNGPYDSYFTPSPTYSTKSTVCNKLIEFCTQLQAYLIQEGFDTEYKPVTGYPSHPQQTLWIYLSRTNHRYWAVVIDVDTLSLQHGPTYHWTVESLMNSLHEELVIYQEYCAHQDRMELVREQCNNCYYGGGYCGLGIEMLPDCTHHIRMKA